MIEIQQAGPGWLAVTVPGRVLVVECAAPTNERLGALWAAVSARVDTQAVLERLTVDGLLAAPAFALLEWDAHDQGRSANEGIGTVRCILRGAVTVSVDTVSTDTAASTRVLSASGVSTWLEQLVDGVDAFRIDLGPTSTSASEPAMLLPLDAGAAWVSAVRSSGQLSTPRVAVPGAEAPVVPVPVAVVPVPVAPVPVAGVEPPTATVSAETVTSLPEAAGEDEPYDHLFGATMMRSVEDAAVRAEDDSDDVRHSSQETAAIDVPAFATARSAPHVADIQDAGDHDGMTVFSGDIGALRKAAAAGSREDPTENSADASADAPGALPQRVQLPETPNFVVRVTGGGTEPLTDLMLVGRSPSVSKVSGGRVPRLVTVGGADQDISRNHVQFSVEGDTVVVTDLHSRNGTMIVLPGKSPQKLRQGEPTAVIVGTLVDLGGGVTMTVGVQ